MASRAPRVLFVSHDASRTGAPIILHNFLVWLEAHSEIEFELLLGAGGPLEDAFRRLCPVHRWTVKKANGLGQKLLRRTQTLAGRRDPHQASLLTRFRTRPWDVIYANTVASGGILASISELNVPAICHIHELQLTIACHYQELFNQAKPHTDRYIAVSQAVADSLVEDQGIDRRDIELVYGFVPDKTRQAAVATHDVRSSLGIPADAFVVGACGTMDWRKGVEPFIILARLLAGRASMADVHLIWIGGKTEGRMAEQVRYDLRKAGLQANVHFVGPQSEPEPFFDCLDAFLLMSREDPFPLVMLEAGRAGKPVLCFDGAGGAIEFVQDDAGVVVPYLDLAAMADAICDLREDPARRQALGRRAAEKVAQHHVLEIAGPKIQALVEDTAARKANRK